MGEHVTVNAVAPLLCWRCGKKIAEIATAGTVITRRTCHARNQVPDDGGAGQ